MNYETDIRIDETALDVEWLEQASLAMKYGKIYAIAKRRLTEVDEKIKVIRAELIKRANEDPKRCCKKDKPNAADIEAYYRNHERHKKAKEEWIEAQYELDMAEIAKNEISFTRKAALENMVKLYVANYFAGPNMPRDITAEREKAERQRRVDSGVANKLSRKKKRHE